MDPESTVRVILSALADHDTDLAWTGAQDLREWISKRGLLPHGWDGNQCAAFYTMVALACGKVGAFL